MSEAGTGRAQLRRPAEEEVAARPAVIRLMAVAALVVLFDIFRPQIVGIDFEQAIEIYSPLLRGLLIGIYALGLCFGLMAPRRFAASLLRAWPIFLVLLLAALSAFWSPLPGVTLQKTFASTATFVLGCGYVAYFGARETLRLVAIVLAIGILASALFAFMTPEDALHQRTDAFESIHAGVWRGVFYHRVLLGQAAALTCIIWLFCAGPSLGPLVLRLAVAAVAVLCLVRSESAGGYAALVIGVAALAGLRLLEGAGRNLRGVLLVLGIFLLVPLLIAAEALISVGIAALGRDLTFTGRWQLWVLLIDLVGENPWLGYGFSAGYQVLRPAVTAMFGYDFVNPHSGYMDILVGLGVVGLLAVLFVLFILLRQSLRLVLREDVARLGALRYLPFAVAVFLIGANVVEAMLIESRGFATALLALTFAAAGDAVRGLAAAPRLAAAPAVLPTLAGQAR
ncbi:O-antigen ligase [Chelatococcus caeni]|uniref:O-antigen ligase n=1 Tax=Chelatococcus caeni TaxID=1348468 RepID=A0A840CAB4_9HYPH|nr:O-antigen ligase family protein [Chelatococcus caeni]MBB4019227.1 O-antigen ligase [Chelatococcus caeni]